MEGYLFHSVRPHVAGATFLNLGFNPLLSFRLFSKSISTANVDSGVFPPVFIILLDSAISNISRT